MVEARFDHTATSLLDGRVLVAGGAAFIGDTPDSVRASAELYDPGSGTWTATASMAEARYGHTATRLPDGTVLVAGGGSGTLTSAELYEPSNEAWTATGSMAEGRGGHTATLLPDGTVLVAGGYANSGNLLTSAELYDPTNETWTATGSMAEGRADATITVLRDGTVLVAGGYTVDSSGNFAALASAELYDPISETWTATGSMAETHYVGTATLLPDGTVLVAGGDTVDSGNATVLASAELYDSGRGSWTAAGGMIEARDSHTATPLPDGRVLVAGGGDFSGQHLLASAELYDPSNGSWTATGSMAEGRIGHTATLLPDGTVLLAGGVGRPSSALASAELYDPGSGN